MLKATNATIMDTWKESVESRGIQTSYATNATTLYTLHNIVEMT